MAHRKERGGEHAETHRTLNEAEAADGLKTIAQKLKLELPLTEDDEALLCEVLYSTEKGGGVSSGGCTKKPPSA